MYIVLLAKAGLAVGRTLSESRLRFRLFTPLQLIAQIFWYLIIFGFPLLCLPKDTRSGESKQRQRIKKGLRAT
jgi:hypothetical protein